MKCCAGKKREKRKKQIKGKKSHRYRDIGCVESRACAILR